ncbi:MAG: TadE/TadG family type IV pilus assembly protein [Actinomycetota bacterium]
MKCSNRDLVRTRRHEDHGAAMVEMALILPLLVMLLVGIVQFGLAYSSKVSIQAAAREGARALALGESTAAVASAVHGAAGVADITSIVQSGCPATSTPGNTSYATVIVNATYTFSIPFVSLGTKTLSSTARMRCGL